MKRGVAGVEAGLFRRTMQLFQLHWSGMPDFTGRCPPPSVDRSTSSESVAFNLFPPRPSFTRTTPAQYCYCDLWTTLYLSGSYFLCIHLQQGSVLNKQRANILRLEISCQLFCILHFGNYLCPTVKNTVPCKM